MLPPFSCVHQSSYMMSVAGNYEYLELITNSKSGSFFFYSHDQRYIIKNMKVRIRYNFLYVFVARRPHIYSPRSPVPTKSPGANEYPLPLYSQKVYRNGDSPDIPG